jgi:hypothetical protein
VRDKKKSNPGTSVFLRIGQQNALGIFGEKAAAEPNYGCPLDTSANSPDYLENFSHHRFGRGVSTRVSGASFAQLAKAGGIEGHLART